MFNGSNCDRKSQLSEILTEPLNPRDIYIYIYKNICVYIYYKCMYIYIYIRKLTDDTIRIRVTVGNGKNNDK